MVRNWVPAIASLAVLLLAGSARSSGCCDETPEWKLQQQVFSGYNNSGVMVPGNDSRVNLLMLLADRHGGPTSSVTTALFKWGPFGNGFGAIPEVAGMRGTQCDSSVSGARAFEAALNADGSVGSAEKQRLIALRRVLTAKCESTTTVGARDVIGFDGLSNAAKPFAQYVDGAGAFYAGGYDDAVKRFGELTSARNPWIRETALYMIARAALNLAQGNFIDDYGGLAEPDKRDKAAIAAAETAFANYLRAYPKGLYAVSARGLMRRVYWLAGDRAKLGEAYRQLIAIDDPAQRGIDDAELVQEIDYKFLPGLTRPETNDASLLATIDLMRMRQSEGRDPPITLADIEAQRGAFAADQPLYDYVVASHALFVGTKPAEVLRLIPDATRQKRFSALQFSRQMLRGFALDAVKDANARGFWLSMMPGATQVYQRKAVELALAMHEERNAGLARAFAPGSQVRDPNIRGILLGYAAGPELLRKQAKAASASKAEREAALFILLYKEIGRGFYGPFVDDLGLITSSAPVSDEYFRALDFRSNEDLGQFHIPVGLFTSAGAVGDFGCPALRQTAMTLAQNPRAAGSRLCIAEFMRVNGFDHFALDAPPPKDELGGAPSAFPGKPFSRLETYKDVIADAKATPHDKAYALYRAVYCYAPAGINDCGGVEVTKAQRRAWYQRLKWEFPQSQWAKEAQYYW